MQMLTNVHTFVKQQFWGQRQEALLPQTDKVAKLAEHIHVKETVDLRAQITKGVFLLGATACSALGAFALFGKKGEELELDADLIEEGIKRRLLSGPEVKATLPTVSMLPNNPMPLTVISMFNLFFDSDGQSLTLEVQSIPSWMVSSPFTYSLGSYVTLDYAWGVYVVGNLAYVADQASGLQIIDVSNPSSPTLKGVYDTPGKALGVHVVGDLAYVADWISGLQIIDVSNPSLPNLKGAYDTPGSAYRVYVVANLAYVADYASGLTIIDVSNPSSPTLKGAYDTPGSASGVYVVANLAYVADGNSGLTIIDVSNPSSPTLKGTYDTTGDARGVYVAGDLAYVADLDSGLQIIDVSNSSLPTLKGTYNTPGSAYGVHVVGNLAYVADTYGGLKIIDISNPSFPNLKRTCNTPGEAIGVHVFGNLAYVADYDNGLQIIENGFALSGTPNQTQVGNYEIQLIAKDPDQNQISQILYVRVEGPPLASAKISNQLVNVGLPFTYFIDQNVFPDPNNDIVFYVSKLADQTPLPSWLSFSSIGIFSGIPRSGDVGTYMIKVLAFDRIVPQQAETAFSLIVDHFPKVTATISDQIADIGQFYNYTVPKGTFTDADAGDVLTYQAMLTNGNPLPSWLSFNFLTLSGTPSAANSGPVSIKLSATDLPGAKAETSFTLTVEHFPDLVNPIFNQLAGIGQAFTFVIPSNTYNDLDGDSLTYKGMRSDGSVLPNWLGFNSLRQEFQGTPLPSDKGVLGLKVIAEDPKGGQAATIFNLNIADSLGEEVARVGRGFVYVLPNNMIRNPQGPITYTVTLGNGAPLPNWLTFEPVLVVISGTPPSTSQGEYILLITANDFVQAPVLASLNLRVGTNAAPQVANSISNQATQVNQNYRFVVPDNTFIDPNGDSLSLSALRANGRGLPSWLTFDAASTTLKGNPGPENTGAFTDKVLPLQICATDGEKQVCSVFDLSVQGASTEERALSVFGPLASAAAVSLAWYKKRGLLLNLFNKDKYDKGTKFVSIGQPFTYKLEVEFNKVKLVQAFKGKKTIAGIPVPKSLNERGWFEWLKHDKAIRGGDLLPNWLQYDQQKNQLYTLFNPRQEDVGLYVVRIYGYGEVILEEIKLDVGGQGSKNVEMVEVGHGNKKNEMLERLIKGNDDANNN